MANPDFCQQLRKECRLCNCYGGINVQSLDMVVDAINKYNGQYDILNEGKNRIECRIGEDPGLVVLATIQKRTV
jgi:hypothetical protein